MSSIHIIGANRKKVLVHTDRKNQNVRSQSSKTTCCMCNTVSKRTNSRGNFIPAVKAMYCKNPEIRVEKEKTKTGIGDKQIK